MSEFDSRVYELEQAVEALTEKASTLENQVCELKDDFAYYKRDVEDKFHEMYSSMRYMELRLEEQIIQIGRDV